MIFLQRLHGRGRPRVRSQRYQNGDRVLRSFRLRGCCWRFLWRERRQQSFENHIQNWNKEKVEHRGEQHAAHDCRSHRVPAQVSCTAREVKRGSTPSKKANDVMRIGRSRNSAASMAASVIERPRSSNCSANSTIKIEFLAESPINMTRPILHINVVY